MINTHETPAVDAAGMQNEAGNQTREELEFIMFLEMQLGIKQSQVDLLYKSGFAEPEDLIILDDQMIDNFPVNKVTKK